MGKNCFRKSEIVAEENFPCHLRDTKWLANLIMKKYGLYCLGKGTVIKYINESEYFNKLRHDYEQKIVDWQINWMYNGGGNWIMDPNFSGEFYFLNYKCDYAFRKGIVDTLLAIGMNIDAIEEGIEKNANKWRERYMRIAFHNLYSRYREIEDNKILGEPSQEHYEKWRKLRLYEYYIEHKNSVDKYGKVLPEMQMTELEVTELKTWIKNADEVRMKEIEEYERSNKNASSNVSELKEIDYHKSLQPAENNNQLSNQDKPKSLLKKIFNKK